MPRPCNRHPDRTARLDDDIGSTSTTCEVDAFRIGQVFTNLFINAIDACPDPVVVTIALSDVEWNGRPGLRIVVRDNGPGFAEESRSKALEPFFTTKPKGTGLGLAIARRIVEAHGGLLEIESSDTPGASIALSLPRKPD